MSSHQVIARKWRPQKFGDVVGQTHVIRTLRNAIAGNRVGHAYLLVGPRGIGKTTIARIFAKAINCEHPVDGEPCCQCSSCTALANESSLDVIEIDAASRNSVEHMRALSEEAYHMPVASKYKIYIIDEVHMLSKAAWNALLKTVEEPPAHVKFIFATTEAHLVLPTIVSRCQRFDLRPIAGNLILQRLKLIAESENVKIAPEALSAIARAAEGGMRDAQSSLEQMLAFFGGKDQEIAAEQVLELFGLTNAVELDTLIAAMLQNQPGPVVTIVNQLAGRGRNLETLFDDVLEMLRGAELMQILNNPEAVLDFDDEKLARCRKLSHLTSAEVLRCFMENLAPVGRVLHEALNKAIYLESILLKAMHEAHAPTVGDVLNRLNQLRGAGELQFIDQVPSFQSRPAMPVMPVVLPEVEPVAASAEAVMSPAPVESAPEVAPEVEPAVEMGSASAAAAVPPAPVESAPEVAPEVEPADGMTLEMPENAPLEEEVIEINAAGAVEEVPAGAISSEPLAEAPPAAAPTAVAPSADLPEHEQLYNQLVQSLQSDALSGALQQCQAVSLTNSVLSLAVPSVEVANELRNNRIKLLTSLQKITGNWAILLDFQLPAATESALQTAANEQPIEPETVPETDDDRAERILSSVDSAIPEESSAQTFTDDFIEISVDDVEKEFQTAAAPEIPDNVPEQFIDLNGDLPIEESAEVFEASDYVYSKRSVIHKIEEVEATAKLPPVQKVLDLFGGEIVDIHA